MRSSLFSNRRYALDSSPPSCVPTVAASKCILRRRRPLLNPIKGASQVRRMLHLSDSCSQGCTQPCMECTIMQIRSSRARLLPVPVSVYYPLHPTGCDGAPPHTVSQLQTHGEKIMTPQGMMCAAHTFCHSLWRTLTACCAPGHTNLWAHPITNLWPWLPPSLCVQ